MPSLTQEIERIRNRIRSGENSVVIVADPDIGTTVTGPINIDGGPTSITGDFSVNGSDLTSGLFTNPMTTPDDLIKGGAAGVPTRVPKGPNNRVFGVDGSGALGYRQVNLADLSASAQPMTTPDDIIKGGVGGAPTRVPKGANNRVLGVDAAGVFGYRQVTNTDLAASAQPMTTADDIIKGGAGGVPTRVPKGADSRVFGVDATGVLGYHEVTSAMVTDGSLVNGDLAAQTIRGGVDGAASRIAPGSLTTVDVQDGGLTGTDIAPLTIPGGTYGAASRIAVGTINSGDIQDASLVNGDLAAQTIIGGSGGAGSRISPGTIYGSIDLQDASLTNIKIAAQQVRGSVDGAAGRISPGSLNYLDLAAGTCTQFIQGAAVGVGGTQTSAPWAYAGVYADIASVTSGTLVVAIWEGTVHAFGANVHVYMGIATPNVTGTPQVQVHWIPPVANIAIPFFIVAFYAGLAGPNRFHAIYGVQNTSIQSVSFQNNVVSLLEFKR